VLRPRFAASARRACLFGIAVKFRWNGGFYRSAAVDPRWIPSVPRRDIGAYVYCRSGFNALSCSDWTGIGTRLHRFRQHRGGGTEKVQDPDCREELLYIAQRDVLHGASGGEIVCCASGVLLLSASRLRLFLSGSDRSSRVVTGLSGKLAEFAILKLARAVIATPAC